MTQNYKILKYMLNNVSITTMEAFERLGVTRLSARIYEIENDLGIKLVRVRNSNKDTWWYEYCLLLNERKKAKKLLENTKWQK